MDNKGNSMEEERMNILRLVEEGKISAQEAAGLLSALSRRKSTPETISSTEAKVETGDSDVNVEDSEPIPSIIDNSTVKSARWFRVRVTDLATGRAKATINLPIGLVNWGLKVGARFAPEISELDFNELGDILQSGANGKMVDVMDEEDGEHVEIFID